MVTFDKLSLSSERDVLNIICSLDTSENEGWYISSIQVEYIENYLAGGPSSHAIEVYSGTDTFVNTSLSADDTTVQSSDKFGITTFAKGLFVVYVYCSDGSTISSPEVGLIIDWDKIYLEGMFHVKQALSECGFKKDFIDFVLRWEAFKLAIDTCDYEMMHCLWTKLFGVAVSTTKSTCCCCN